LLFGIANFSGKLPITFPAKDRQAASSTVEQWPGVMINGILTATYTEGLQMGYRWFDAHAIEPLFPFGYGLSYTTFELSKLEVTPEVSDGTNPLLVQFFVANTGSRYGAEVSQVYLGLPASLGEPPKRLIAFRKVWLNPGEETKITISIDPSATNHPLGYWDSAVQTWKLADGNYEVYVGNSAASLVLKSSIIMRTSAGR
jgi:beta-glucosidase